MFLDGTFVRKAITELTLLETPPLFLSHYLMSFLRYQHFMIKSSLTLRYFFSNLHNIVRTLKTSGHEVDLRSAANMEQIVTTLAIAIR